MCCQKGMSKSDIGKEHATPEVYTIKLNQKKMKNDFLVYFANIGTHGNINCLYFR